MMENRETIPISNSDPFRIYRWADSGWRAVNKGMQRYFIHPLDFKSMTKALALPLIIDLSNKFYLIFYNHTFSFCSLERHVERTLY